MGSPYFIISASNTSLSACWLFEIPSTQRRPTATSLWRTPNSYISGIYLLSITDIIPLITTNHFMWLLLSPTTLPFQTWLSPFTVSSFSNFPIAINDPLLSSLELTVVTYSPISCLHSLRYRANEGVRASLERETGSSWLVFFRK